MKKLLLSCLCLLGTASLATATDATFDFTDWNFPGADSWEQTYGQHVVTYDAATVTFEKANKQPAGQSITDCPVTKGQNVTVTLKTGTLNAVTFNLKQWGSKKQTATLWTSTDGTNFTNTNITSTNFMLSSSNLGAGIVAARVSFSSASNQVGISSIAISYTAGNPDKKAADLKFSETSVSALVGGVFFAPTLTKATTADVTYSSDNDAVATVDATTGEVTIVDAGTAVITATAEENTEYNGGSASYTIVVKKTVSSIFEMLQSYGDIEKGESSMPFVMHFEPVVVYVNGSNNYIYDGQSYSLIYKSDLGLNPGDKLGAGLSATLTNYNGLLEIVPEFNPAVVGTAEIPAPKAISASDLTAENQSMYVLLEDVEFAAATPGETATKNERSYTGTFDNTEVNFFNNFKSPSVEAGKYDVTGFISVFNTTVQVAPVKFEKDVTAIDAIEAEADAPAEYYNLQGVRVSGDEPGIYVVRQGGKVTKIVK
ncbi:MAG: Ig-like domain-containing protein [Muribaculaceae bacterium]